MKLPAIQFYTGDWRKDPGIQALDFEARGIWFEMLCLMNESAARGKLTLNGEAMPITALARILGVSEDLLNLVLTKLLTYGVASKDPDTGIIFNRRMVRDEEIRKKRAECGKLGGNPVLLNLRSTKAPTNGQPLHEGEDEDEVVRRGRGAGEGVLTVDDAVWIEKIQTAYPDRSCQRDTAPFILASMQKGFTPQSILDGTKEAARLIAEHFPTGIQNRYVPRALAFFRGEKWEQPEIHFSPREDVPNGKVNAQPKTETIWQLRQALDVVKEKIVEVESFQTGAWGELPPAKKKERGELIERKKELQRKISGLEA